MPDTEVKKYMVFIERTEYDDTRYVRAVPLYYNTVTDTQNQIPLSGRDKVLAVLRE